MKNTRFIIALMATLLATISFANDGVYYTSGNQLIPLSETDISVKKEILTISLLDDGNAKIDVYYEFLNSGNKAKTVKMGFEADPSYNDDYTLYPSGIHPNIKDFTVEINNQNITYKNAICNLDVPGQFKPLVDASQWQEGCEEPDHGCGPTSLYKKGDHSQVIDNYAYVYYFDGTFKPGINKVHHTYTYQMSVIVGTSYYVPYKLSPASRWANKQIDDFTLIVRADNTAKNFIINKNSLNGASFTVTEGVGKIRTASHYDNMYWEFALRNGAVTCHINNFSPKPGENSEELCITSADQMYSFNEDAVWGSYYDRSSSMMLYMWQEDSGGEHKQKLTPDFFKRISRNLPYANRGHVFKDTQLKKYFESLWWYMPDPTYKDDTSDFTEQDWEYINGIKRTED